MTDLSKFFEPESIAVVGASRQPGKVGYTIVQNLIEAGFVGPIYPVNPQADEILGLRCYRTLADIPGEVDLAVIVIPARAVLAAIQDCADKRVSAAIVISAGFKEAGKDGAELEQQLVQLAQEKAIRMVGPNCLGVINTHRNLNASFAAGVPGKGSLAFISQSGAFGTAILDWALGAEVGFSKFVSLGNRADVDEAAVLDALEEDERTSVILAYLESVKDGKQFVTVAERTTRSKPVVVMKAGRTAAGARAASSHTGALAGSEAAFQAAMRKCGVRRAHTVEEFFDYAIAFGSGRGMRHPNVAIVTNAGGPGVITADAIEQSQLKMANLSETSVQSLHDVLPAAANVHNPVDVLGDASPERYGQALRILLGDAGVDGVIALITPQAVTDVGDIARVIADAATGTDKPILAALIGGKSVAEGTRLLMRNHVPTYPFPERAVKALEAVYAHHRRLARPAPRVERLEADSAAVRRVLDASLAAGRAELGEAEAREIVTAYGFRVPRSIEARTEAEAVEAAQQLGFPVVLKVSSPDILHKSDVGGVRLGLQDAEDVRRGCRDILEDVRRRAPKADVRGVLVQEMIRGGREVILGVSRDPQFGPLVMVGLGGIYVEILKDVVFRLAPVSEEEAREMLSELKSYALLGGARGEKPADVEAIVKSIQRVSQLVVDFPQIAEMDINPLVAFPEGQGAVALDARMALRAD
jgi:acetyltransferase